MVIYKSSVLDEIRLTKNKTFNQSQIILYFKSKIIATLNAPTSTKKPDKNH